MDTLSRETTLSKLFCLPSEERFYSKKKEFAPLGSKFFPFSVDPFSEEDCHTVHVKANSKSHYLPCEKIVENFKVCPFTLMHCFSNSVTNIALYKITR